MTGMYWRPATFLISAKDSEARLVMSGYKDKAKRDENPSNHYLLQKGFTISGLAFSTYAQRPLSDILAVTSTTTVYDVLAAMMYHIAKNERAEDQLAVDVPYFADATDVL